MNWRFILFLSPVGILMGSLLVLGISVYWVFIFYTLCCLLTAYLLTRYLSEKRFISAMTIGTLWGILQHSILFLFFNTYLVNNLDYENILSVPQGIHTHYWILPAGLFIGLASGLLIAIFTWLLKKVVPLKTY